MFAPTRLSRNDRFGVVARLARSFSRLPSPPPILLAPVFHLPLPTPSGPRKKRFLTFGRRARSQRRPTAGRLRIVAGRRRKARNPAGNTRRTRPMRGVGVGVVFDPPRIGSSPENRRYPRFSFCALFLVRVLLFRSAVARTKRTREKKKKKGVSRTTASRYEAQNTHRRASSPSLRFPLNKNSGR